MTLDLEQSSNLETRPAGDNTLSGSQAGGYVLKFISGKYQGGEFPLEMGQEVVIGRSSELDMVLVEDMVSRRHARITAKDGDLEIEDFGSTNGTFVNGKKIKKATLEQGDRILIGTSIIKLVEQDGELDGTATLETETATEEEQEAIAAATQRNPAPTGATRPEDMGGNTPNQTQRPGTNPAAHAGRSGTGAGSGATLTGSISGLIEEVPLPDLLQLFSTSQKSGVLVVHHHEDVGKVYLRDGRVFYATINDDPDISPHKAFYRMLAWEQGTFSLEHGEEDQSFEDEIDESIENLLMEGMRQLDEIRNLGEDVPELHKVLAVNKPLVPPLRSLTDELLDTLQLVFNYGRVSTVLNKSLASDLDTMQDIVHLLRKDYISVND